MATEKKFIQTALSNLKLKDFLEVELKKAGVSTVSIQRTPLATRIKLEVLKPGMVVGKRGSSVTQLTEQLNKKFGIENPQLDIVEVLKPELDAKLMAEKIGRQVEMNGNIKQVMRFVLKDIMNAGAIGAELVVAGKVVGKGAKAKALRYREGYLKKSGEAMKLVHKGKYVAYLKAGAIGIVVRIVKPGTVFVDQIKAPEMREFAAPEIAEALASDAADSVEKVVEKKLHEAKEAATAVKKPAVKKAKKAEAKPETGEAKTEAKEKKPAVKKAKKAEPKAEEKTAAE